MRIFVTGGSQVPGLPLALRAAGHQVLSLARTKSEADDLQALVVDAVPGALFAPATYQHALEGVHAVLHLEVPAPSALLGASDRFLFLQGMRGLVGAAQIQRVPRFVLRSHGELYAPAGARWLDEAAPLAQSPAAAALREAEETLASSGLSYAIARTGWLYGDGVPQTEDLRTAAALGQIVAPHRGERYVSPVHARDLVAALAALVQEPGANGVYNVCDERPLLEHEVWALHAARFGAQVTPSDLAEPDPGRRLLAARLRLLGVPLRYRELSDWPGSDRVPAT